MFLNIFMILQLRMSFSLESARWISNGCGYHIVCDLFYDVSTNTYTNAIYTQAHIKKANSIMLI